MKFNKNSTSSWGRAQFSVEHERDDNQEEVEFQLTWSLEEDTSPDSEEVLRNV